MSKKDVLPTLRIGLLGSGFIARLHLQAMIGVRNVTVAGVYSTTAPRREALAARANQLGLGPCRAFASIEDMVRSGAVDALWILSPNDVRLATMREIHRLATRHDTPLRGVACEKPLARTVAEARAMLRLAEEAGLAHGYLENQLFSTAVMRGKEIVWRRAVPSAGRPYLARAAEEHGGPHEPWFWQGDRQGGGVLSDMMCHAVEVARFLLTAPGAARETLRPVSASGTVANLKWTQPRYARELDARTGGQVDFTRQPVEDFARATVRLATPEGQEVMIEATASWAYVGAGLRIQLELLGPEYAMDFSSLSTGLKVFMSRAVAGGEGEDLVEKQNAEQGLMPVVDDEAGLYGFTNENRHFVECFRKGETPIESFADGVEVVRILMALYRSAETGRTVLFDEEDLESYVPPVARPGG